VPTTCPYPEPAPSKYVHDVKNMKVNFLKESCGTSSQDLCEVVKR
jgi:hypothetical protein